MLAVGLCLGMKRSSTCTDLMSMGGDVVVDSTEKSKKRLSSEVFGWDHYRSEEVFVDDEYQTWRKKKRLRKVLVPKNVISPFCASDSSIDQSSWPTDVSKLSTSTSEGSLASTSEGSLASTSSKKLGDISSKEKSIVVHISEITHELAAAVV